MKIFVALKVFSLCQALEAVSQAATSEKTQGTVFNDAVLAVRKKRSETGRSCLKKRSPPLSEPLKVLCVEIFNPTPNKGRDCMGAVELKTSSSLPWRTSDRFAAMSTCQKTLSRL